MANRLQRDQTAQQLWANAAGDIRCFESPVNWRFKAAEQDQRRSQLILQTPDFWNLDWYGNWGQVSGPCPHLCVEGGRLLNQPRWPVQAILADLVATDGIHNHTLCDRQAYMLPQPQARNLIGLVPWIKTD